MLWINERVAFVPELYFSPSSLRGPASASGSQVPSGRTGSGMLGAGCDDRGILDRATTDCQTACIDLLVEVDAEVVDHTSLD